MTTTFRFGTTSGPCKTTAAERAHLAEETAEKGNCDPDKLLQCPFDKSHQIRACRFPYHLIKCRKNHPQLANELKTCPFNARHLVPKHELTRHTETCEDRISVDSEDEADDAPAPFVWGKNPSLNQQLEMRPTNNLGPSFRAPNTLPWSGFKP
uniref:CHHC U11-48K-type domain-containing protein n=1 Tax=Seriola lalandi dorsalis TaxID=1841481 RepID=A0A3B4Y3E8_SERLL